VLRNIIIDYLVVGVVVADSHHYFTHLNSSRPCSRRCMPWCSGL